MRSLATPSAISDQLQLAGMPASTQVSVLSTAFYVPPSPSPSSAGDTASAAAAPPPSSSSGGSSIAVWVWAVIGVCAGLAIVAAGFIGFVLLKKRRAAAAAGGAPRADKRPSQRVPPADPSGSLKDEEFSPMGAGAAAGVAVAATALAADHEVRRRHWFGGGGCKRQACCRQCSCRHPA